MPPDEAIGKAEEPTLQNVMDAIVLKPDEIKKPVIKTPVADDEPPKKPTPTPEGDDDVDDKSDDDDLADHIVDDEEDDEEDEGELSRDPDSSLVEVTVDGEVQRVTLKELKNGYSGSKAIAQRIQQVTEARNKATTEYENLSKANEGAFEKLKQLDAVLEQFAAPKINWEELKAKDPLQYALKREEIREVQEKQKLVQAEMEKVKTQQRAIEFKNFQNYLSEQAQQLMEKLPEMSNPKKATATMNKFVKAGSDFYGYSEQELRKVSDHRVFMVLSDAVKYRELLTRRKEAQQGDPTVKSEKKTLRVGASVRPFRTDKKKEEAIVNRARTTGKPEDVAETLLVRANRR